MGTRRVEPRGHLLIYILNPNVSAFLGRISPTKTFLNYLVGGDYSAGKGRYNSPLTRWKKISGTDDA